MSTSGKIMSLHLGRAREVLAEGSSEWWDKPWQTGFYKTPQTEAHWLGYEGFRGDEQADRRYHGGPEKAVCVYSVEHYPYWREMLGFTAEALTEGAFGENFTTSDLLENHVCIGDVYRVGEARVQVSQPRQPCWKLARRWHVKDLAAQVERTGFTGFYFRVLHHGNVAPGDELVLAERSYPSWTISRCNEIMHHQKADAESARELASCPLLSSSWKDGLWARAHRPTAVQSSVEARTRQPG